MPTDLRVSQVPVEVLWQETTAIALRVSQVAIEVVDAYVVPGGGGSSTLPALERHVRGVGRGVLPGVS